MGRRRFQLCGKSVGGAAAGAAGRSQLYRFQAVGGLGANVHTAPSDEHVHRIEAARSFVVAASSGTEDVHGGYVARFMIPNVSVRILPMFSPHHIVYGEQGRFVFRPPNIEYSGPGHTLQHKSLSECLDLVGLSSAILL